MNKLIALFMTFFALVLLSGTSYAGEMMEKESSAARVESSMYTEDELMNLTVFNREGKEIGEIQEVWKDSESGVINFVILASGGVLGIGETEYTLPLQVLDIRRDEQKAVLLVTEDKLANAPMHEVGVSDAEYGERINKHYGIAPAWEGSKTEPREKMGDEKMEEPAEESKY